MARDSQETRRRIFDAATAEFTTHGIAGARVDRIAAAAGANKQLIYVYFGNKRKLFEAVVADHVARFMETVPFDAADLPRWAGEVFDFFVTHPEVWQLGAWHALEPRRVGAPHPGHRGRNRRQDARDSPGAEGRLVETEIAPAELLALVNAIARAWAVAPPERTPRRGLDARSVKRRRIAVVEATRRLVTPTPSP